MDEKRYPPCLAEEVEQVFADEAGFLCGWKGVCEGFVGVVEGGCVVGILWVDGGCCYGWGSFGCSILGGICFGDGRGCSILGGFGHCQSSMVNWN